MGPPIVLLIPCVSVDTSTHSCKRLWHMKHDHTSRHVRVVKWEQTENPQVHILAESRSIMTDKRHAKDIELLRLYLQDLPNELPLRSAQDSSYGFHAFGLDEEWHSRSVERTWPGH